MRRYYAFFPFVILYILGVASFANFGVIDDHSLTTTLLQDKAILLGQHVMVEIGRFFPLNGQDLNLISLFFSPSPAIFYAFNAACVLVILLALFYALRILVSHLAAALDVEIQSRRLTKAILLSLFILLVTPAFIQSHLRLFVPERMEFLLLSLFLACYAFVLKADFKNQSPFLARIVLTLGLALANMALYYKETAFAFLASFGLCHLLLRAVFGLRLARLKIFDLGLVISSLVWLGIYFLVVVINKQSEGKYGGEYIYQSTKIASRIFFSFWKMILNEPFLILSLLASLVLVVVVLVKRRPGWPLLVALSLACLVFVAEYIVIGIFPANHYLLPCYIFGLPLLALAIYMRYQCKIYKGLFIVAGVYSLVAVLPNSLLLFGHYKLVPNNFQENVRFLASYLQEHGKAKLYLHNMHPVASTEVYASYEKWLNFYGADGLFDLDSELKADNTPLYENSPHSAYNTRALIKEAAGDLVVLPYSNYLEAREFLNNPNYELVQSSRYNATIPSLSIRSFIRFVKLWIEEGELRNVGQLSDYNFYVFLVKG